MSTEFVLQIHRDHTGWAGGNAEWRDEHGNPVMSIQPHTGNKTCTPRDKAQPWEPTELSTLTSPVRTGTHTWLLSFLLLCFSLACEEPRAVFPLAAPSVQIPQGQNQTNSWVHLVARGPSPRKALCCSEGLELLLTRCSLHLSREPH